MYIGKKSEGPASFNVIHEKGWFIPLTSATWDVAKSLCSKGGSWPKYIQICISG